MTDKAMTDSEVRAIFLGALQGGNEIGSIDFAIGMGVPIEQVAEVIAELRIAGTITTSFTPQQESE